MRKNDVILLNNKPKILGYGSVVGTKERKGPIGAEFDCCINDSLYGEKSFEKAEIKMQKQAKSIALKKANISEKEIDNIFAGDLLNQCIGSSFAARESEVPYIGLYNACATMTLAIGLGAIFIDTDCAKSTLAVASSHFCTAERQYRYPLDYGSQRTPTAQWTVTGSGALVLGKSENRLPYINSVCFGRINDKGITDTNNMGAAMAPVSVKLRPYPIRN